MRIIKELLNFLILFISINLFQFVNAEIEIEKETLVKVSIIIPSYNSADYLDRCIEHALNQTLSEIEVIVINDNSTDDTEKVIEKYNNDERFRSISLYPNKGPSVGRNLGIEMAVGEFIGFIDSDDYVDYEFYENLYKLSKDKDIVIGVFVNSTNDTDKYTKHSKFVMYGCVGDSIWRKRFLDKHQIRFIPNVNKGEDIRFRKKAYNSKARIAYGEDNGYKSVNSTKLNNDMKDKLLNNSNDNNDEFGNSAV
ncbi:nucleotide-diphospho-sugar transferase [Anaeromyces robustus]|uniref:Nucleotide-diphospho-sugar transferase n=1 Tax=Anaeromyces robustus TaxID=1754192 RepID=A0A1Y1X4Z7_9FUNG|nr:nucleotide-diphospho-sugar transferase [Anaeromyces robustus]|eukprot:ORX80879.1 nucleotide-diphospho-sugar transferase [Anaeromyces robustus]